MGVGVHRLRDGGRHYDGRGLLGAHTLANAIPIIATSGWGSTWARTIGGRQRIRGNSDIRGVGHVKLFCGRSQTYNTDHGRRG